MWWSIAVLLAGGLIGWMIGMKTCDRKHVLPYEYRVICDATDSIEVYTLITPDDDTLGSFSNPMMMDTLITNDNI